MIGDVDEKAAGDGLVPDFDCISRVVQGLLIELAPEGFR